MNFNKLINISKMPELYEKGTAVMWTDEYISQQLLAIHLNNEIDLASRKGSTIDQTVEWILNKTKHVHKEKLEILDLGCGPGLYCQKLAEKGHHVTGMDFSKNSIAYAKKQAKEKGLNINYRQQNYLELTNENQYDLVICIYTDFGVLLPNEREQFLQNVYRALKPGGIFIFDVLNDKNLDQKISPKNWEISEKGFWREAPYLSLSESFFYEKQKVILSQHVIINENEHSEVYRFWTHFFSNADLKKVIKKYNFEQIEFFTDILPKSSLWDGDNVTFCITRKINN